MTLGQLNRKWMDDEVAEGNPLSRTTFNRHRDAILDMFGIIIDCAIQMAIATIFLTQTFSMEIPSSDGCYPH